jgi:V8-like Glu-specific endopeptidase
MDLYQVGKDVQRLTAQLDGIAQDVAEVSNRLRNLEALCAVSRAGAADVNGPLVSQSPNGLMLRGRNPIVSNYTGRPATAKEQAKVAEAAARTVKLFGSHVCGADDRIQLRFNPHFAEYRRPICYLETDQGFAGTGTLISPRHVLTVAHVVLAQGSLPKSITVTPCQFVDPDGRLQQPLGSSDATSFHVHPDFDPASSGHVRFDVGMVVLPDDSLFQAVGGHFGVLSPTNNFLNLFLSTQPVRQLFHTYGYPGDLSFLGCITEVMSGSCDIDSYDDLTFTHHADEAGGQSGSPIFTLENGIWSVWGMISQGFCPASPNVAKRIDDNSLILITAWMNM